VCDQETSQARRLSPLEGCKIQPPMGVVAPGKKKDHNKEETPY